MGPDRIGAYVDAVVDLAAEVHAQLDARPRPRARRRPELSTVVFRYRPDGMAEDVADALTPGSGATLYERGAAMVAATKVDGRCWLKLTLLNPLATRDDILGDHRRGGRASADELRRWRRRVA